MLRSCYNPGTACCKSALFVLKFFITFELSFSINLQIHNFPWFYFQVERGSSAFIEDEIEKNVEATDKIADLFSDLEGSQPQSKEESNEKYENDLDLSVDEDMFSDLESSQSQMKSEQSQILSSL